ncbi:HAMP domain-containing sensor histidine kinase [Clostridium sp. 1001271B_151109_B4]|uniref:sensor histidine kinase n=1 Tax=Clostridium sp. 1001271B_151109_B4 TaxID=2787148 RepID=UPI0018AAF84A|nr:HAMP domain-containing sensor histidine kinase [Clostridium sp. 1001271B_151109_B4]
MLERDTLIKDYNREYLEEILDKLPYHIWLKNEQMKYIYINRYGAEKLGLTKEKIIGKSDYELREYDIAKKCEKTDKELIDNNRYIYNEEYSNVDGQNIWHKVHKFILNTDVTKEKVIGGVAKEVSLDKNIQLRLERNLLNYLDGSKEKNDRAIIQSILKELKKVMNYENIDILLYDEDKKMFNFYISENEKESKFKIKIYIDEEIENKLCDNEIDEKKYSELYDKIEKLQKNNIKENLKIKHIQLANKLFALVLISYNENINYINQDDSFINEILKKISIIIKQMENKSEVEDNIKLESMKIEFLSNISHEFRTPINIILSTVQLLNLYNQGNNISFSNEKYKEYLNILKQNSYRLLRLVNNIMDTAKINSSFYDLKLGNYDIVSIVENITMSTVQYANEKQRNIIFDTDIEEVILACDQDKIERIMLNLISNAIKFSDYNTDIEIKIKMNVDLNKVFISVKNYGEKIDYNNRERIFGKFSQVDDSLTRRNEGSGIGLFLARNFVEMHGGKIYLDNIDKGTQFTFYLPIKIIEEEIISKTITNENSHIERCNIEFSDIYD